LRSSPQRQGKRREDDGEEDADLMQGDDNPGCSPAARRATRDMQAVCRKPVKYSGMGVLHDLP
jgi:hypothetical protein